MATLPVHLPTVPAHIEVVHFSQFVVGYSICLHSDTTIRDTYLSVFCHKPRPQSYPFGLVEVTPTGSAEWGRGRGRG